jgi:hypothetical protein
MKKIIGKKRAAFQHLALKREKRRLHRIKKKKDQLVLPKEKLGKNIRLRILRGRVYKELLVPAQLDFSKNRERTFELINNLREIALSTTELYFLNFLNLQGLSPAAGIVLLAEIYRAWKFRNKKVLGMNMNKCSVAISLKEMGFFDLLDAPRIKLSGEVAEEDRSKKFIKFATSVKDDGQLADEIRKAITQESPENLPAEWREKIYRGLLECMSNVSRHAYSNEFKEHITLPFNDRRWWASGYIDKEKGDIMVQFYDQGAGIPNTLLTRLREKALYKLDFFDKTPSASLIKRATEPGESSTKKHNRGKGLPEIVSVIKTIKFSQLRIISDKGEYKIYNENGIEKEELIEHTHSLGGTLVQWKAAAGELL